MILLFFRNRRWLHIALKVPPKPSEPVLSDDDTWEDIEEIPISVSSTPEPRSPVQSFPEILAPTDNLEPMTEAEPQSRNLSQVSVTARPIPYLKHPMVREQTEIILHLFV